MHHIYHTEAIILGSKNYGEAGRYYFLFTKDLGLVYASAIGVRKMSSKLRFILQDLSYIKVDLIEGKDFWKITSASKTNILDSISRKPEILHIASSLANLLKRLLAGAEQNKLLFSDFLECLLLLENSEDLSEMRDIEIIIVLRILNHLGYIGEDEKLASLIRSPFEREILSMVTNCRPKVLREINKAFKETHL
jgi:DNA repair protein RecO (recombination protein O)